MDQNFSSFMNASKEGALLTQEYTTTLRCESSCDSIIPDTVADVDKILLCSATPKIEGQFLTEGQVEFEGTVCYELLLMTENNTLTSHTISEPFTLTAKDPKISQRSRLLYAPNLDYVTPKLLNPRKVNLRSQTSIALRVFDEVSPIPTLSGVESLSDDMNLQRSFREVTTATLQTIEKKEIPVSHDIELDSSAPAVSEIVHTELRLHPFEVRSREGEVDVRTHAYLTVIYLTEQGNYLTTDKSFVLETSLPLPENAPTDWLVFATPGPLSATVAANSYGEMKVIEVDFVYDLLLSALGSETVSASDDMYSTEFEAEPTFATVNAASLRRGYVSSLSVNASVPREELHAESVQSVLCGKVHLKDVLSRYDEEKGKLVVEGTSDITLVGENNRLSEEDVLFDRFTFTYPFRCELDAGEDLHGCDVLCDAKVSDLRFRVDSGALYADFEVCLRAVVLGSEETRYLCALSLNRNAPISHKSAPMTLCYPSGKETLWDIAKYYKITEESILDSNAVTREEVKNKKVLLIPRAVPKRPLFTKVI